MSDRKKRRTWSASEKLRIVLAGLARRRRSLRMEPSAREQRLETENARLKSVVVEITTENLDLKKGLSE